MRLNEKGMAVYAEWEKEYEAELAERQKEDPNFFEGWCIIENDRYIKSAEDLVGILIYGDDDNAIYHVLEYSYGNKDTDWGFGVTAEQLVEMLKPYFDIDDDEYIGFDSADKVISDLGLKIEFAYEHDLSDRTVKVSRGEKSVFVTFVCNRRPNDWFSNAAAIANAIAWYKACPNAKTYCLASGESEECFYITESVYTNIKTILTEAEINKFVDTFADFA